MELIIRRHEWLRGEGGKASYLLRPSDHKLCCVGIYMRELGVTPYELEGARTAEDLHPDTVDKAPGWLFDGDDDDISMLYSANDDKTSSPEVRETDVSELFAKHGIEVKFED